VGKDYSGKFLRGTGWLVLLNSLTLLMLTSSIIWQLANHPTLWIAAPSIVLVVSLASCCLVYLTWKLRGPHGIPTGIIRPPWPGLVETEKLSPDKAAPPTLGWRCWLFDLVSHELTSPHRGTVWATPELRCEDWCESDVIRGVAGIHAHLVPENWLKLDPQEAPPMAQLTPDGRAVIAVTGIVERFGKFVRGTEGWRAEWVIIRKLRAPTTEIGLALEAAFPDVEIVYDE
jgi:hypothetical protein